MSRLLVAIQLDNIAGDQSSLKTSDGEAVVKPGGQLKADMLANGENVDWINSSIDNTGMGVTVNDPKYRFLIGKPVSEARTILQSMGHNSSTVLNNLGMAGESGRFMSLLSQNIDGVRSSSVMHDRLVGLVERGLGMESTWYGTAFTVGSIPPAFYAQYTAFGAHAYDYYYRNLKR